MASRTRIRKAALLAAATSALLAASPASAIWFDAPLVSGKAGDAATFGRLGMGVDGDRAVIANGTNGPVGFTVGFTAIGTGTYTTEVFGSAAAVWGAPVQGIAIVGDNAFFGCGTYLYRFTRSTAGVWNYAQYWNAYNTITDVAADGNVVAFTYGVSSTGGSLGVIEKVSGVWSQTYAVNSSVDYFGEHVEVQDLLDFQLIGQPTSTKRQARIIVSGRGSDSPSTNAGAAYIYEQSWSTWGYSTTLNAAVPTANDEFGAEVALDGAYAYVADLGSGAAGAVEVFQKGTSGWSRIATIQPAWATASFGQAIDADGDRVAIGTNGHAYLYQRSGTAFTWATTYASRDPLGDPSFGIAVAIDGDSVLVGGGDTAAGAGTVYFFQEH